MTDLAYPHIAFNDSIVGPAPEIKPWRDGVGVAGTFGRGSEVPNVIGSIQEFASIYGIDSTPGSLFVQQAMANGITNFTICRASAASNPATTKLTFSSGNAAVYPQLGYTVLENSLIPNAERTTGFKLGFNFIGDALPVNSLYSEVTTKKALLDHPTFNGQGRFNFFVTKAVEGNSTSEVLHNTSLSLEVEFLLSSITGYQVALVKKNAANLSSIREFLQPGYSLTTGGTIATGTTTGTAATGTSATLTNPAATWVVNSLKGLTIKLTVGTNAVQTRTIISNTSTELVVSANWTNNPTDGSTYTITRTTEAGTDKLLLASKLIDISNTHYGLLVKADQRHTNTIKGSVRQSTVLQTAGLAKLHVDKLVGGNAPLSPYANPGFLRTLKLLINGKVYTQSANPLLVNDNQEIITLANVDGSSGDIAIGDESYSTSDSFVTTEGGGYVFNELGGKVSIETISNSISGDSTTGYKFSLNEELPALNSDTVVEFLPSVLSTGANQITLQGLLRPEDIVDSSAGYSVSIEGKSYTVLSAAAITQTATPNTIGRVALTVAESVSSTLVGKTAVLLKKTSDYYQVKFPSKAQYVIGYSFDSQSNSSFGSDYYSLNEPYTDGYGEYNLDSYFLLNEVSGGVYRPFYYQEVSNGLVGSTAPSFLTERSFGLEILWGNPDTNILPLETGGQFNVPFAKTSVLVGAETALEEDAYEDGTTLVEVIQDLETAIRTDSIASSLIETITLDEVSFSPSITLTSSHSGEKSNRIAWNLTRYTTGMVSDVYLEGSSDSFETDTYLTDGYDGASFAFRDLYAPDGTLLWKIIALTPGVHGNNLRCTISNQRVNQKYGAFQLDVLDLNTRVNTGETKKSFVVDTSNIDSTTGRSLTFLSGSNVQAYFMPAVKAAAAGKTLDVGDRVYRLTPQRLAPPLQAISSTFNTGLTAFSQQGITALQNFNLAGGSDNNSSLTNATAGKVNGLIKAIEALESYNIAVLALPGISYGDPTYQTVFDAAKASVERSTAESGLRSAIFELPAGISPEKAQLLADELDSERVILVAGRQLMRSRNNQLVPNVGSSGSYAGYDLSRAPHISPAASFGGSLVQAVSSVDTLVKPSYLDKMARAGVEVLVYDANIGGFRFSNGLTTSRNGIKRYRSVTRILDQVKSDLYLYLQWVRSRPNTAALQSEAATACDAYLYSKLRDGWFTRLDNTICNATNNSQKDQAEGRLNIRIRLTPSFPADKILVDTILDLTEDFSLQTAV